MKPSEIRALSVDELRQKEMDLRKELFNLRFQISKGEQTNNMRVNAVRKDIARVLTIITEKEASAGAVKKGN
ncbi:MAG: 50S ribosomal protein L29 [Thermodesulfovibrionales bacterium]|jgi:large subunit ribosomal protein L29